MSSLLAFQQSVAESSGYDYIGAASNGVGNTVHPSPMVGSLVLLVLVAGPVTLVHPQLHLVGILHRLCSRFHPESLPFLPFAFPLVLGLETISMEDHAMVVDCFHQAIFALGTLSPFLGTPDWYLVSVRSSLETALLLEFSTLDYPEPEHLPPLR